MIHVHETQNTAVSSNEKTRKMMAKLSCKIWLLLKFSNTEKKNHHFQIITLFCRFSNAARSLDKKKNFKNTVRRISWHWNKEFNGKFNTNQSRTNQATILRQNQQRQKSKYYKSQNPPKSTIEPIKHANPELHYKHQTDQPKSQNIFSSILTSNVPRKKNKLNGRLRPHKKTNRRNVLKPPQNIDDQAKIAQETVIPALPPQRHDPKPKGCRQNTRHRIKRRRKQQCRHNQGRRGDPVWVDARGNQWRRTGF